MEKMMFVKGKWIKIGNHHGLEIAKETQIDVMKEDPHHPDIKIQRFLWRQKYICSN